MNDWPNLLIRQDFTEVGEMLADVPLGVLNESSMRLVSSVLAEYGPESVQDKWNLDEASNEFSLNGAEVVFNDRNHPDLPTFSFFKYALGVRFPERSIGPVGVIYMCWKEPVVVTPEEPTPAEE